jgi:NhaP-type Na+/H+ or K+/H+ antiporter
LRYALPVTKTLRALCASALLLLLAPTMALAATPPAASEDQVTLAMFGLIGALVAILAILVAFEVRKGNKH